MITRKNESENLAEDMSCECKCKFDGRKCISDQKWNKNKCRSKFKKHHICKKKIIFEILLHVVVKMENI